MKTMIRLTALLVLAASQALYAATPPEVGSVAPNFRLSTLDAKPVELNGLRWDAMNETAYPSAFIIGQDGKVRLAHVSKTHGGRLKALDVLKSLQAQTET